MVIFDFRKRRDSVGIPARSPKSRSICSKRLQEQNSNGDDRFSFVGGSNFYGFSTSDIHESLNTLDLESDGFALL